MLNLFIDLAQACNMLELRGCVCHFSSESDASASFSANFNKADNVEFWFSQIQKMSLCQTFLCKILLNMLQCQLIKKSLIIDCVLPEKEKLLGSAHAQ